ncbi:CBM96 family carbohydrate-binding protein [Baekduia soli]|nr:PKD domain-containing protein [Baekduia soli]
MTMLLAALGLALCLAFGASAADAAADVGVNDGSYAPLSGSPTGTKPESKLWYTGGSWWGVLYSVPNNRYDIFKFNVAAGTWSDTGVVVENRGTGGRSYRTDTLWDGSHLYVASHYFDDQGHGASPATATSGTGAQLYRYSFSGGTYTRDQTSAINPYKTETLVIDKDSTGTLWSTWTYNNTVWVAHTVGGDRTWSAPYQVPGSATLDSDDISSLVRFGGNRIGVMWSSQVPLGGGKELFSVHTDGTGDSAAAWKTETVPTGASPDDHINLKADAQGRVYAAVKTSESSPKTRPLVLLLTRSTAGTWTTSTFGTVTNSDTRPIVELDEQAQVVHMFATCPQPPSTSGQSGGDICERQAPMSTGTFGTTKTVISQAGSPDMNDVTSTKQNVSSSTGLLIEANDKTSKTYWHAFDPLGGGVPTSPTAAFTETPASGVAPLTVQFTNTSTNATSYSWDFGDGSAASTETSPSHTFTAAGTYTVTLTATGSGGQTSTATHPVSATTGGGGGGTTTLTAVADTNLKSYSPTKAYGTATTVRTRLDTATPPNSYLGLVKFDLSAVTGTVQSATLRIWVTDASKKPGNVFATVNMWGETSTWNTRPAQGAQVGTLSTTAPAGAWESIPVTGVTTGGNVSFYLPGGGTDSLTFSSRETGANAPQLVVTTV